MSSSNQSSRRWEPSGSCNQNYAAPETSETEPLPELSSMSFEELIQIQNKVGRKAFRRSTEEPRRAELPERAQLRKMGPLEMSSKKPVPYLRKVISSKEGVRRDPRFDDLSGEYKHEMFTNAYKFLDDIKKKEREIVQKKLQRAREPQLKEKLQQLIQKMDQQEEAAQRKQKLREKDLEYKRRRREDAQQGKRPFYMKKGDMRKVELADKYQDLKRKGKVEHFLSKKRKRNSHKDRRRLPNQ